MLYRKYEIEKTTNEQYKYNVKILFSENRKERLYTGHGRFCKTLEEAKEFIAQNKNQKSGVVVHA